MKLMVLVPALLLALTGCKVGRKDPRVPHQGPPPKLQEAASPRAGDRAATGFYGLNLDQLYQRALQSNTDREQDIIKPLAKIFLDGALLTDPKFRGHAQTNWALSFFNAQLILRLQQGPTSDELKQILQTYSNRILAGCHMEQMTGCRNLQFFRRDPQLASVLKYMARSTADVETYYRLLFVAYEIKGRTQDAELQQLVFARAVESIKRYVTVRKQGEDTTLALRSMNTEEKGRYLFQIGFLSLVLKSEGFQIASGDSSLELFDWLSSGNMENVLGRDLSLAMTQLISQQLNSERIWPLYVRQFSREQDKEDLSYLNALKRIHADGAAVLDRLGVKPFDVDGLIKSRSKELAAFHFFARVFDLKVPSREIYLLRLSEVDPSTAADMIEAILRVTLVDRMLYTNKKMAEFYRRYQQDGRARKELIDKAMEYSDINLTPMWKDYISRVQQLETVFESELEKRVGNDRTSAFARKVARVRNLFDEFNPAIKYMVTYPNMMMLGYYAAKFDLNYSLQTFFGSTININKDLVLHDLLEGNLEPLFLFTSFKPNEISRNATEIDSVQMQWALYFAMVTDLPRHYGISAADFMGTFFKTYKQRTDERLRTIVRYHEELVLPNSDVQQTLQICRRLDGRAGFEMQKDFEELARQTFLGELSPQTSVAPLRGAIATLDLTSSYLQNSFDEALETIRSDVDPKLSRLYLLKAVFSRANSTETSALAEIDAQMSETLQLRSRVIDSTRRFITELPPCFLRLRELEHQRRKELFAMERQFIQSIALALNTLANTRDERQALKALSDQGGFFQGLRADMPATQALNEVVIEKLGLAPVFARTSGYEQDFRTLGGFQKDNSGRIYFNYRHADTLVRLSRFLDVGFLGARVSHRPERLRLTYPLNMRDFQRRTKVDGSKDVFLYTMDATALEKSALAEFTQSVRWFRDISNATGVFRTMIRHATALHKFEYVSDVDVASAAACEGECLRDRQEKALRRSYDLIALSRTLLQHTTLTPSDAEILRLFDANSYYGLGSYFVTMDVGPRFLFVTDTFPPQYIGLADEAFTYLTSRRLGYDPVFRGLRKTAESSWVPQTGKDENFFRPGALISADELIVRTDPYDRAKKYFLSLRDKDKVLLFPIETQMDAAIDLFHTKFIRSDAELAELFMNAVRTFERSEQIPTMQFAVRIAPKRPEVVSSTLFSMFQVQMEHFHQETGRVFEAKK